MHKFIFDVDGTLTPSRQRMDNDFKVWFTKFCERNDCYLVTGSDREKTVEQVGDIVYNRAKYVFQCGGNEQWCGESLIKSSTISLSTDLTTTLNKKLEESQFISHNERRNHIEIRSGLVNFSIVGRPASEWQRARYAQHDELTNERHKICEELSLNYEEYQFSVAGETGIDITYKGMDKSQILDEFSDMDRISFFGDMTGIGGNDYQIAAAVESRLSGSVYTIDGWQDTWNKLKQLE
tara:strand:- start:517 stop:1227 length:711 start_codon:yes stop_codon:yes gene_type:complete